MTTTILALLLLSRAPASVGAHHAAGVGYATFYNETGRLTASNKPFNPRLLAGACRAVRRGSRVRVTAGRRSLIVLINDAGPYPERTKLRTQRKLQARVNRQHPEYSHRPLRVNYPLDLTPAAWRALGLRDVTWVRWEVIR